MAANNKGKNPTQRAAMQRQIVARLHEKQAAGAFGGPGVPSELMPGDALLEEVRRTAGIVRWLEYRMATEWSDELIPLGKEVEGAAFTQWVPTNESEWYAVYQKERQHLARCSKMCLDAGVAERQVKIAEANADLMYQIIASAFKALGLTEEQEQRVPAIMGEVLTKAASTTQVIE